MIGEAILAIKALDSAFVMVQGAIAKKKEVEEKGSEEEENAKDVEQKKAMEDASNDEEKEFEEIGSEEEEKAKNVEEEEDVESTQARPFHSNIPNLIFSTLL